MLNFDSHIKGKASHKIVSDGKQLSLQPTGIVKPDH